MVDTLSDTRTAVDFVYDERHNISQVDIAGATVLSKEIIYNANGCTQSETTYGNGQKIKKYYDRYDRLIKVSDVTTDETALVQYLYSDDEISQTGFDPDASFAASIASPLRVVVDHAAGTTTWYTYDEFGQVKKVQNQQITTTQTKDEFNRIKIVAHSFGGNFATNYTYASPTDDTLVAESTGGEIPIPISTTYVRDGLQRPTETIVMHGDFGYKQVLAYAPKQQEEWVDDGFGPIIRPDSVGTNAITPPSLGGHWEVTNIGTTQYVSSFKEYSMSGTTATLVRSDAVEYDANGNITKYGGVTYEYDKLGRLTKEINPTIDRIKEWCYDISGNILSRTEHKYTTGEALGTFEYEYETAWKDQLKSFNGQTIEYDDAGNPTSYKGANLTWERGRLLKRYNNITMQYDANGIRTRKIVPGLEYFTTTEYLYSGNNLLREIVSLTGPSQSSTIYKAYLYNSQGIIGFVDGSNTYTYRKNMFGDIIAIYNGSTKVAEYAYDAWGNCLVIDPATGLATDDFEFIGHQNPFRYRGYYWDNDLQLYYLMSRYYDPQTGRFINVDSLEYLDPETIGGLNLYVYCGNNPVMGIDPLGTSKLGSIFKIIGSVVLLAAAVVGAIYSGNILLVGAAIGGVVGMISNVIVDLSDGEANLESIADSIFAGTVTGMASGALAASGAPLEVQIAGNALINSGYYLVDTLAKGKPIDPSEFCVAAFTGAVSGLSGGPGLLDATANAFGNLFFKTVSKEGLKIASQELLEPILKASLSAIFAGISNNIARRLSR